MKASNNTIQDRKEEIDKLNQKVATLQGFYDEQHEFAEKERQKNEKAINEITTTKDEEIKTIKEAKDLIKEELDKFKGDFQKKMAEVKMMEQELEEKLAKFKKDDSDEEK